MEICKRKRMNEFRLMQDVGLGIDTPICQYMDLDFFQALLESDKYYVKAKKEFPDNREKRIPDRLRFAFQPAKREDILQPQPNNQASIDKAIQQYEKESSKLLTSCWTERIMENALMWDRGGERHKVCVKSTIGNFAAAFDSMDYYLWCGRILYEPIGRVFLSDDVIWYKEPYFSDEREIRFYFSKRLDIIIPEDGSSDHRLFKVNINTLIDEVILSPYIDKSAVNQLKKTFEAKGITTNLSKIEVS